MFVKTYCSHCCWVSVHMMMMMMMIPHFKYKMTLSELMPRAVGLRQHHGAQAMYKT